MASRSTGISPRVLVMIFLQWKGREGATIHDLQRWTGFAVDFIETTILIQIEKGEVDRETGKSLATRLYFYVPKEEQILRRVMNS